MKFRKALNLLKNRRGVNAVISNVILVGAVIAVGFAMLFWSQSQASSYNNQYSSAIKSDTDQLRERVVFEYIHYDSTGLWVYLMNSGTIGGITIANVYVDATSYGPQGLRSIDTDMPLDSLNTNQEGYFLISSSLNPALGTIDQSIHHSIKIVTGRGSSFVATFAI